MNKMERVSKISSKYGITPEQVEDLVDGIDRVWQGVAPDFLASNKEGDFESPCEMVVEAVIDADRLVMHGGETYRWVYEHPKTFEMSLEVWAALGS
jgi:hypothetical protein